MVSKPFLYLKELRALAPGAIEPETEFDKRTAKKIDKLLKELRYYEHCDVKFGEICKHPRCTHAIFEFKNGNSIVFRCGRLLSINEMNKEIENNGI